jgi:D-sedoheptulose 7-phosphate isomerase
MPQTTEFLEAYRRRLVEVIEEIDSAAVGAVVDTLYDAYKRGSLVLVCGNGGSAATASHMANDLVKATRVAGRHSLRAVSLCDNVSLLTAFANDEGYDGVFARQVEAVLLEGDVLIAISASGNSPNIIQAVELADQMGATTIGFTGFSGGKLSELADLVVHIPTEHGAYGHVEDAHMTLDHMITGALYERIADGD